MDWGSVTADDLIGALREVDWSSPPRPLNEFFSKFNITRSYPKWSSRLKCNLYYYRTNYFILIVLTLVTFSEKTMRTVRKFSPHLAAKMRPPHMPVIRGRPSSKKTMYICGQPRGVFVFVFTSVSLILWFASGSLSTVLWALVIALLATIIHASVRTPNLKARLNTFREEFREVWRNYSDL
ncbi:unnamed protein product [Linum tenue]|uniref:PRA1 family protein n=1 Tax=Linum tenue TaxID=586396 RepID=A0AAV0M9E6_9ROSI|nr:unnamed protein product [Linum tenue]